MFENTCVLCLAALKSSQLRLSLEKSESKSTKEKGLLWAYIKKIK